MSSWETRGVVQSFNCTPGYIPLTSARFMGYSLPSIVGHLSELNVSSKFGTRDRLDTLNVFCKVDAKKNQFSMLKYWKINQPTSKFLVVLAATFNIQCWQILNYGIAHFGVTFYWRRWPWWSWWWHHEYDDNDDDHYDHYYYGLFLIRPVLTNSVHFY